MLVQQVTDAGHFFIGEMSEVRRDLAAVVEREHMDSICTAEFER